MFMSLRYWTSCVTMASNGLFMVAHRAFIKSITYKCVCFLPFSKIEYHIFGW